MYVDVSKDKMTELRRFRAWQIRDGFRLLPEENRLACSRLNNRAVPRSDVACPRSAEADRALETYALYYAIVSCLSAIRRRPCVMWGVAEATGKQGGAVRGL
jgi:hypothetical protein